MIAINEKPRASSSIRVVESDTLERRNGSTDRRMTQLSLTETGSRTLADVARARRTILGEMTADQDAEDKKLLAGLLLRLGEGFDAAKASE